MQQATTTTTTASVAAKMKQRLLGLWNSGLNMKVNIKSLLLFALLYITSRIAKILYVWKTRKAWLDKQGVPSPKGHGPFELLGHFPDIVANFHRLYDWKLDNGVRLNTLTFSMPMPITEWNWSMINSYDPKVVRHILSDKFNVYVKSPKLIKFLECLVGDGIFGVNHGMHAADNGLLWKFQRKAFSKLFTENKFDTFMTHVFKDHAQRLVKHLDRKLIESDSSSETVEMEALFAKFTLDSIAKIAMGIDLHSIEDEGNSHPFHQAFDDIQRSLSRRFVSPLWEIFGRLYKNEREIKQQLKILDDFIYGVIDDKRKSMEAADQDKPRVDDDVLAFFISEQQRQKQFGVKKDEVFITDKLLRGIITSLFLAGRDTTKTTLSFLFISLAERPDIQEKLHEEIASVYHQRMQDQSQDQGQDQGQGHCQRDDQSDLFVPTLDELHRMPYLEGVVYETVRLFPAVPTDSKMCMEKDVLPDGTVVLPYTNISYEPYGMARRPEIWGENCAEFRPERWIEMDEKPDSYTMCAWQGGRRECLGKRMSILEVSQLTAALVKNYKFEPVPNHEYTWSVGVTLNVKNGVPLRISRR